MNTEHENADLLAELDGVVLDSVKQLRANLHSGSNMQSTMSKLCDLVNDGHARDTGNEPAPTGKPGWSPNISRVGLACGIAVTTIVAVVVFSVADSPKVSLAAQIANSFADQVWIHVSMVKGEETIEEIWFSPTEDVSARTTAHSKEYSDHLIGENHFYSRDEQTLYRMSERSSVRRFGHWAELATSIPMLLDPIWWVNANKELYYRLQDQWRRS